MVSGGRKAGQVCSLENLRFGRARKRDWYDILGKTTGLVRCFGRDRPIPLASSRHARPFLPGDRPTTAHPPGTPAHYTSLVFTHSTHPDSGWTSAADGTLEQRRYYCQNWRADVSAIVTSGGVMVEWDKYTAYGIPISLPAGDTDSDGDCDSSDESAIHVWAVGYDVRYDYDLDGDIDGDDETLANANTASTGWNVLSAAAVANRIGYAGYQKDINLDLSHVRNRVYSPELGRWTRRDPFGYIDGMSLYEYVNSSPASFGDPLGLRLGCPLCLTKSPSCVEPQWYYTGRQYKYPGAFVTDSKESSWWSRFASADYRIVSEGTDGGWYFRNNDPQDTWAGVDTSVNVTAGHMRTLSLLDINEFLVGTWTVEDSLSFTRTTEVWTEENPLGTCKLFYKNSLDVYDTSPLGWIRMRIIPDVDGEGTDRLSITHRVEIMLQMFFWFGPGWQITDSGGGISDQPGWYDFKTYEVGGYVFETGYENKRCSDKKTYGACN